MHPAPDQDRRLAWSEWALFALFWPILAVFLWIVIVLFTVPLWGGEPAVPDDR